MTLISLNFNFFKRIWTFWKFLRVYISIKKNDFKLIYLLSETIKFPTNFFPEFFFQTENPNFPLLQIQRFFESFGAIRLHFDTPFNDIVRFLIQHSIEKNATIWHSVYQSISEKIVKKLDHSRKYYFLFQLFINKTNFDTNKLIFNWQNN